MTLTPGKWHPVTKSVLNAMDPDQYHWLRWASGNVSGHTYRPSQIRFGSTGHPFDVTHVAVAKEQQ